VVVGFFFVGSFRVFVWVGLNLGLCGWQMNGGGSFVVVILVTRCTGEKQLYVVDLRGSKGGEMESFE
jgi:hypothetical protein